MHIITCAATTPPHTHTHTRDEILGVFQEQLFHELEILETEVNRSQKSEEKTVSLLWEQLKSHASSRRAQQKQ